MNAEPQKPHTHTQEQHTFLEITSALEPYSAEDRMRIMEAAAMFLGLEEILSIKRP